MKPQQILEIADKNGFDWWGSTTGKHFFNNDFVWVDFKITLEKYSLEATETRPFSLADLATNKSFLEALGKVSANKEWGLSQDELDSFDDMEYYDRDYVHIIMEKLQRKLINDLTNNNGKDFWKICRQFLGATNE